MSDELEQEEVEQESEFDGQAREMGWQPKENWDGPEDKWVDAKTFVERGEHIMPIMRANNKRLKQDLLTRDKEIATLKQSVEAANKAIKALQKHHTEATAHAVEQAKKDLREQLKQAREVGDFDAEEEIRDKLSDLKQTRDDAPPVDKTENENGAAQLHPDFIAWRDENPWFSDTSTSESRKRIREFVRIGEDLREDGDNSTGREFMDKCLKTLEEREGKGKSPTRTVSKVESGASGDRRVAGGRAFDNLPKEAKAICHEDNDSFVGPGKMFKTVREWEDHYAKLYSED